MISAEGSINLLLSAINLGAIGVSGYVLYRVWNVIESRKKEIPNGWIRALIATMSFTVILVLISAAVELAKFFGAMQYNEEVAKQLATSEAVTKEARRIVCQSFFDPQPIASENDEYRDRAPNGLYRRVRKDPVFQDFKGEFLVQRLWAEPTDENSLIRAWSPAGSGRLLVEFCRKGNGCDVTLKPKMNEAVKTTTFSRMIVRAQGDAGSACNRPIAFHVRVIDGRGNHWAWGELTGLNDGSYPSVDYGLRDATGKEMVLKTGTPDSFIFDISSRRMWAPFEADGSIAPLNSVGERFACIQGVTIEPGLYPDGGSLDPKTIVKDPHAHKNHRYLNGSPGKDTSLMSILYVGFE